MEKDEKIIDDHVLCIAISLSLSSYDHLPSDKCLMLCWSLWVHILHAQDGLAQELGNATLLPLHHHHQAYFMLPYLVYTVSINLFKHYPVLLLQYFKTIYMILLQSVWFSQLPFVQYIIIWRGWILWPYPYQFKSLFSLLLLLPFLATVW